MIVYGIHPVIEALEAKPDQVEAIFVVQGIRGTRIQEIIELAKRNRIPVHAEPAPALNRRTESRHHQGVAAELTALRYTPFEEVLEGSPQLFLLLDAVEDPHNLGAVLRTAEAAGVDAVLLPQRNTCGLTPAVFKASAGAALHMNICRIPNVVQTLERLKKKGFWVVGLDLEGEDRIDQIDPHLPLVLVVGGESSGLRRLVRENCDFRVRLPMKGKVQSLNLSVAAGVLVFSIVMKR